MTNKPKIKHRNDCPCCDYGSLVSHPIRRYFDGSRGVEMDMDSIKQCTVCHCFVDSLTREVVFPPTTQGRRNILECSINELKSEILSIMTIITIGANGIFNALANAIEKVAKRHRMSVEELAGALKAENDD